MGFFGALDLGGGLIVLGLVGVELAEAEGEWSGEVMAGLWGAIVEYGVV